MYRAVALWALRANVPVSDMHRLEQLANAAQIEFAADGVSILLNDEDVTNAIRTPEVSQAASEVSLVPAVRRALVQKQREIGERVSIVMEGRDIGTVVFPDARVKIYLDASAGERARRRATELDAAVEQVAREIAGRDHRDRTRAEAPLTQAPDADYIDSSGLTPLQVEEAILKRVRERTSN